KHLELGRGLLQPLEAAIYPQRQAGGEPGEPPAGLPQGGVMPPPALRLSQEHDPLGGIIADDVLGRVAFLLALVAGAVAFFLPWPLGWPLGPIKKEVLDLRKALPEFLDRAVLARRHPRRSPQHPLQQRQPRAHPPARAPAIDREQQAGDV